MNTTDTITNINDISTIDNVNTTINTDILQFYKSAGIVINELCNRISKFRLTSNYKNLINYQLAHNSIKLKDNLVRYFNIYAKNFTQEDKRYNDNLLEVIGKGNFNLSLKEYREKYENVFLMGCKGINIDN